MSRTPATRGRLEQRVDQALDGIASREPRPFLVAGQWRDSDDTFEVCSPFDGRPVASVSRPGASDIEDAVAAAAAGMDELPMHVRADALEHIAERLRERHEEVAASIAAEGGKPIKWARVEATRASATFKRAAEECRRAGGELMDLGTDSSLNGRFGVVRRFPRGPVLGITPFNFPVNLVAHKLAPALAVGAPIVIKPATKTPLGALLLAELVSETELPPSILSVLPVEAPAAEQLVRDSRFATVTFTGSSQVGWHIRALAPRKFFTLELGGNAGVVVCGDADIEHAARRIAFGGFYAAGQSCISTQRVFVQHDVAVEFTGLLVDEVQRLKVGDPMDPSVDVGPMIDAVALDRVAGWVDDATGAGAEVLTGGTRSGPFYPPTVLRGTRSEMKVRCEEVFGPVVTVDTFSTFDEAIELVNDSHYGLQAGVFTNDVGRLMSAFRRLEVGGVIANDTSAFRADQMPYGGTKDSGTGREGLRWAMEEMTEPRILVLSESHEDQHQPAARKTPPLPQPEETTC